VMAELIDGKATNAQVGALLAALRTKRESVDELVSFATVMRERSVRVSPRKRPLIDTCGTGADACDTFNISTAAAFIIAAAGVAVAKHGNRAVSSRCGSADVLRALGVHIELAPEDIGECIDTVGLGFMFAPAHHPATRNVAEPRRELGLPTIFNIIGPLTNPAGASRQLVGVFEADLCPKVAEVLNILGCERAMVVHGMNGLDEISTIGATRISQLQHGRVSTETRIPAEFFVVPAEIEQIAGGDSPEENGEIMKAVLGGQSGPRRDIVSINAAAGLILGGMADTWRDGISLAHRMIDTGRATKVLDRLVEFTTARAPKEAAARVAPESANEPAKATA